MGGGLSFTVLILTFRILNHVAVLSIQINKTKVFLKNSELYYLTVCLLISDSVDTQPSRQTQSLCRSETAFL